MDIIAIVLGFPLKGHGIATLTELRARRRSRPLVRARHVIAELARRHTKASLIQIGRALDRDHSTVMHGLKLVAEKPQIYQPLLAAAAARVDAEAARRMPPTTDPHTWNWMST